MMDADCAKALSRLGSRRYAEGLEGYGKIIGYGIAFHRKRALAKAEEIQ